MSTNGQCLPCPYDCFVCTYTGKCLSCNQITDYRVIDTNSSRCVPLSGYFDSGSTICQQCPQGCVACYNLTFCVNCQQNYFMRGDSLCYSTCPDRFFPDNTTLSCQGCPYDCKTCDTTGFCQTCDQPTDNRYLNTTSSRCVPQHGFY